MPGTILGIRDIAVIKTIKKKKILLSWNLTFEWARWIISKINFC